MDEALTAPLAQVGGKALSLARLAAGGLPVPEFFVVRAEAFERHLAENGLAWSSADRNPDALQTQIASSPLPDTVLQPIRAALGRLESGAVAVRSSGAAEDSASASFAGQFATILGVPREKVGEAVRECWASCLNEESVAYRRQRNIPLGPGPGFAVVVQRQVFPDRAGVLFTRHPLEREGDAAYLEANFGTGESVVGGMVSPDGVSVSRSTGRVAGYRIGSKKRMTVVSESEPGSRVVETEPARRSLPVLSEAEAERLVALGLEIEELMGEPQDIEWAFDPSGLWILQARPQTGGA